MRAVCVCKPGELKIVQLDKPALRPYQALVRTEVACLCNATDGKLIAGHFPGVDKYPMILGHEDVGIVEAIGSKVRNFKPGDRAVGGLLFEFSDPQYSSGWGGFCEYTVVNDHDAMIADGVADAEHGWFECYEIQRKVDADIPVEEAVMLCTWREVLGGFGDFNIKRGDRVLIFGSGPVGLSFVKFGRLLGLEWIGVVDPLQSKRARALEMGADAVFAPDSPELAGLKQKFAPGLDVVVDAVGNPKIADAALPLIKMGGTIGIYGVIAEDSITLNKALGPYNFNVFVHQWPTRWREREAQKQLCEWIRQGRLKASEFVTHRFALEDVAGAVAAVKRGEVIKCVLTYR